MKALAGIAIVLAQLAGFAALEQRSRGTELAVELPAGTVPAAIADRVEIAREPDGPGLRRTRWRIDYRGGFVREVGATALVGPVQTPGACVGRVVVGQRMLDALAPVLARVVANELAGTRIFGLGDFERVDRTSLRWARGVGDYGLTGPAGALGYVRVAATIVFERVAVPVVVALIPEHATGELRFRAEAHAELAFGNRALEWLSRKLPTAELASRLANRELDAALVTTLAPPPPVELGDGQTLRFTYCAGPIDVHDGAWGAVPFGVATTGPAIHFAPGPRRAPRADTRLALDLDLDAVNAMLAELWRTHWLDRRLAEAGLAERFDRDPTVAQYLSVRISPPTLALPPVAEPAGDHLRLAADARVRLHDGAITTTGRLFGAAELALPGGAVKLAPLELACERDPTTLVPCYADLVAGLADRADELDGALARAFAELVRTMFSNRRLETGPLPAAIRVRGATLELEPDARGIHVELDAELVN